MLAKVCDAMLCLVVLKVSVCGMTAMLLWTGFVPQTTGEVRE